MPVGGKLARRSMSAMPRSLYRIVSSATSVHSQLKISDNSRQEVGVQQRELSPIIGLKKFNNWIKSVLIGKFTHRAPGGPGANVLDIGCGKGGDLNKWKQARIKLYVALGPFLSQSPNDVLMSRYRRYKCAASGRKISEVGQLCGICWTLFCT